METRATPSKLASAGLSIPPIMFGTGSLGNLFESTEYDVKRDVIEEWFNCIPGVVAVDSAGKYGAGLALETLGRALSELSIAPDRVVISNKLGWRRVPLTGPEPTFEPGAWFDLEHDAVQDISYDGILRCWKQGCELLGPYRSPMASVHDPDEYLAAAVDDADRSARWDDILGAYKALGELRDRGEVAAIGVGSKDWRTSARLHEACDLDWVMLATSLTVYTHTPELLEFIASLHADGIAVFNSAVFHAGFLTGGRFFDYRTVNRDNPNDRELFDYRDRFHQICERFNVRPANACVSFGMSPPGVVATALSSTQPERVAENVAMCTAELPNNFWCAMKKANLIDSRFPYLGFS